MKYTFIMLFCCLMVSCQSTKKVLYLQDVTDGRSTIESTVQGIVVQPRDILSIVVSSKDPVLAATFNLPLITNYAGSETMIGGSSSRLFGYVVDPNGNIDFPVLGKLKVDGLTRAQLSEKIKEEIIQKGMIFDPVVTTEFMNFKITVLGEVYRPGSYPVMDDKITILEAIGKAGDLTIFGKRESVLVIRETEYERVTYRVDLRSSDLFNSPCYFLKQNDVVYVEPNKVKSGQSNINENTSVSRWISVASLLATLYVVFLK